MEENHLQHSDLGEEISALERLAKLKEAGVLDPTEFKDEKEKILHHTLHHEESMHESTPPARKINLFNSKKKNTIFILSGAALVLLIVGLLFYTKVSKSQNLKEISEATLAGDILRVKKLLQSDSTLVHAPENLVAIAASLNKSELVNLLLKYHANPNGFDEKGMTALAYAVDRGDTTLIVSLLLNNAMIEEGIRANGQSPAQTPLMIAAKKGRPESASLLLIKGANVNSKDSLNKTAIDYAIDGGKIKITTVLMRYGAHPSLPKSFIVNLNGRIYSTPCNFKIYVDDYGEHFSGELIASLNSEYGNRMLHYLYVHDGDYYYTVDMDERKATRSLNDNPNNRLKGIDLDQLVGTSTNFSIMDTKIDTALFAGKVCQLITMKDYANSQAKCWLWNGIPLKILIWKGGEEFMNLKVSKIDEKAVISEEKFKLPRNVFVSN